MYPFNEKNVNLIASFLQNKKREHQNVNSIQLEMKESL